MQHARGTHLSVGVPSRVKSSLSHAANQRRRTQLKASSEANSLDHPIGNLLGHLELGHLDLWQVTGGIAGAVDGGGEGLIGVLELDALEALSRGGHLLVGGDGDEMDHVGSVCALGWIERGRCCCGSV